MSLYSLARWHHNYDITVVSRFKKKKKIVIIIEIIVQVEVSEILFGFRGTD